MDVESPVSSSVVEQLQEAIDVTDGLTTSILEHENNNLKSTISSAKQNNIFLENNVPLSSTEQRTSPITLDDTKHISKPKTLAETIETLKQNAATPVTITSVNNSTNNGSSGEYLFSSRLSFTRHSLVGEAPSENSDNRSHTAISGDIICNYDGTVYLTPSSLSCKLLTPNGVLNEPSDLQCSPFPVSTKHIRYCREDSGPSLVLCYSISVLPELGQQHLESSPHHLVICLPCRFKFDHLDQLVVHGESSHNIVSSLQHECYSNTSALIQQLRNQSPTLHFLRYEESITVDSMLSKTTESANGGGSNAGSRKSSSATVTPPPSANKILSPSLRNSYCEEHPEGGIECPKCDIVLSSTRSLGGHMTMMHSRNSCKTLKCPKCNWHYKYQETLEIHMKEKHPDTDQTCIYCVTKQIHPRLARGESYMCGYKPYRCEVCNYSTTTKGNLSIHMQSDKHINNIQELQNVPAPAGSAGGSVSSNNANPQLSQVKSVVAPTQLSASSSAVNLSPPTTSPAQVMSLPTTTATSSSSMSAVGRQPKTPRNTFRCDVCNYETNIARNLRIHMTSEKHNQNMVILHQNVRSMHRNMNMTLGSSPGQSDAATIQRLGTMFPFDPLGVVGQMEALSQQQGVADIGSTMGDEAITCQSLRSRDIYGCVICNAFTSDNLIELENHISADRSSTNNSADHVSITNGTNGTNYLCKLCDYKTLLKANFQLHCKTDKHVQRVQLVNHIREGGSENEWRMRYLNMPNPVHIVCNVCTYQSNSIHKMSVHSVPMSHVIGASLFIYLRRADECIVSYQYHCGVCPEITLNKIAMVTHVRMSHASQIEQLCKDGWKKFSVNTSSAESLKLNYLDVSVEEEDDSHPNSSSRDTKSEPDADKLKPCPTHHQCSHCTYAAADSNLLEEHVAAAHSDSASLVCPLCTDKLDDVDSLLTHLFSTHNVNKEGAKKLLAILDTASWKLREDEEQHEELYRCQTCTKTFTSVDELYQHQTLQGHLEMKATSRVSGYLCWKKGCNQYFKSDAALQTHFREIHSKPTEHSMAVNWPQISLQANKGVLSTATSDGCGRSSEDYATSNQAKCFICDHIFRSASALQKHIEVTHAPDPCPDPCPEPEHGTEMDLLAESTNAADDKPDEMEEGDLVIDETDEHKKQSSNIHAPSNSKVNSLRASAMCNGIPASSPIIKMETAKRDERPYKCTVCKVSYSSSVQLDEHLISLQHQTASTLSMTAAGIANVASKVPLLSHETVPSTRELNDSKDSTTKDLNLDNFVTPPTSVDTAVTCQGLSAAKHAISCSSKDITAPVISDQLQMCTCQYCNSKFVSQEILVQHQKLYCSDLHLAKRTRTSRNHFRKLLNSFGIECVMGFLESEQQRKDQLPLSATDNSSESGTNPSDDELEDMKCEGVTMLDSLLPPEMSSGKLTCSDCGQIFSGIWVLKAHKEECHDQILPEVITSHFAKLYKKEFEEKEVDALNAVDVKTRQSEAKPSSPPPIIAQPAEQPMKTEPVILPTIATNPMQALSTNPMDLMNFPSMNPWLSMFPFGMMPPAAMFNPLVAQSSILNMASKTQPSNSMSSPPLMSSPKMDTNAMISRQHSIPTSTQQPLGGEKRARTRISDDQLKVLRQYFDINNSPSEESITEMATKTGLPTRVIKHWFRNTLFKERQRNKDSPYNFSNPPQTTLNLEEYEKTGRVPEKIGSKSDCENSRPDSVTISTPKDEVFSPAIEDLPSSTSHETSQQQQPVTQAWSTVKHEVREEWLPTTSVTKQDDRGIDNDFDKSAAVYPTSTYDIDSDQDDHSLMSPSSPQPSVFSENAANGSNIFSKIFSSPYKFHEYSSSAASKRANRTRFTDFQIKTLQDYFEQNAYPKDEELEQLSRVLQLPNRVIVVWFQNARQKARKVYENSPATTSAEVLAVSQPAKSTYPCKKCGVVFTGYYELVKHQKRVCMKNNIVPLPFGNQESQEVPAPSAKTSGQSHHSISESYSSDTMTDITSKQANAAQGLLSPRASATLPSKSLADNIAAATAAMDMANIMSSYNNPANLGSLFSPLMPLPGVLGNDQSVAPIQNIMKDLYEQSLKKYLEENQRLNAAQSVIKSELTPASADVRTAACKLAANGENPLDLSRVLGSASQQVMNTTDEKVHQKLSGTSSVGEEEGSVCDSDMGDELDSTSDGRVRSVSGGHSASERSSHNKRYRTNLTNMQIHVMKYMFKEYKTPTMAECDILGSFIGLQKRVIQVWFQNARAKEKKNKLVSSSSSIDDDPLVTECLRCGVIYSSQCSIQEHIFSARHINQLRSTFSGKLTDCDRDAMRKQAEIHRMPQGTRRVSSSIAKKPESSPKMVMYPTNPVASIHAGKSSEYQNQLSRNLLSSLNPMSGMMGLPPTDMLSLMYPNMIQQMPSFVPGLLPGGFGSADQSMGLSSLYSSLEFGTPLSLLQIPQAAIRSISSRLTDTDCAVAHYSQDCSSLEDLYNCIADEDICIAKPSHADVGYACRQCQFVFPRNEACVIHQSTSCYVGKKSSSDTILKIEQLQYSCLSCKENLPTTQEFKNHCITEAHKYRRIKLTNNNNESEAPSAKRLRIV